MCQLADKVESESNTILNEYIQYKENFEVSQIELNTLKIKYDVLTSTRYTKQQVEELLQKQRELCAKEAECEDGAIINLGFETLSAGVKKDSILNAKLEI